MMHLARRVYLDVLLILIVLKLCDCCHRAVPCCSRNLCEFHRTLWNDKCQYYVEKSYNWYDFPADFERFCLDIKKDIFENCENCILASPKNERCIDDFIDFVADIQKKMQLITESSNNIVEIENTVIEIKNQQISDAVQSKTWFKNLSKEIKELFNAKLAKLKQIEDEMVSNLEELEENQKKQQITLTSIKESMFEMIADQSQKFKQLDGATRNVLKNQKNMILQQVKAKWDLLRLFRQH